MSLDAETRKLILAGQVARLLDANLVRVTAIAAPAPAAEIPTFTLPAGGFWEFIGLTVTLAAAAPVANRVPHLIVDDGTTIMYDLPNTDTQAATATVRYGWYAEQGGWQSSGAVLAHIASVPKMYLPSGWRIRTLTDNIQAGDQYGIAQLLLREMSPGTIDATLDNIASEFTATLEG